MEKIYHSVSELIGHTPLLELHHVEEKYQSKATILAKVEFFNPAGSVKDRVAYEILEDAKRKGILKEDSVIIEPTSGNTGIGLASVAAAGGYKVIIVMPDTMSIERRQLMSAYGAELVLSDGKLGMSGAIARAEELQKEIPNSFIAGQFVNPANPQAHYQTTGPEIWADTDGKVDVFVAGIGTGGTITGIGTYLKEQNPEIQVIGFEPAGSPFITEGHAGTHGLQGLGAGFIPEILNLDVIDEVMTITDEQAYETARILGQSEGILCGISSGAALHAALNVAARPENEGKKIVVLLPDGGDRYLSSGLF